MTQSKHACESLLEHPHQMVQSMARQLLQLHEALASHLEGQGIADETGGAALDIPLLVANREFDGLCPECGSGEPQGDICNTCCDVLWSECADAHR